MIWERLPNNKLFSQANHYDVIAVGVLIVTLAVTGFAMSTAQTPNACVVTFNKSADSAAKRHLASTKLVAYQKRALARIDSMAQKYCTTPTPTPAPSGPSYASQVYYSTGVMYGMVNDTASICAAITDKDGKKYLAWPPVHIRAIGIDSVMLSDNVNSCGFMFPLAFGPNVESMPPKSVTWSVTNITGGCAICKGWRPFPSVVE